MEVFLTGSTGLLGCNTTFALLEAGHRVRALARDSAKARRVLPEGVEVVEGDLGNVAAFSARLQGCDAVIHAGAYFREYFGRGNHAPELKRLNVDATVELARAARDQGVRRFVFVSSSGTVGERADGTPSDETDPPAGVGKENLYFMSKWEAEAALREAHLEPMEVVSILPGWMFGPGDSAPTSAGEMVRSLIVDRKLQIVDGTITVADARDVADALVRALTSGRAGERYCVAGMSMRMRHAMTALAEAVGDAKVQFVPYPMALMLSAILEPLTRLANRPNPIPREGIRTLGKGVRISSAKAERELGVAFRPFSETAHDTVAWFRREVERGGYLPTQKS
jgi:dihydroflavonol-4-reductase